MVIMVTSAASCTQVKGQRRVTPKVRTGCITCKARRVKCDEGKPGCSRCTSTGRKCEGYARSQNHNHFSVMVVGSLQSPRKSVSTLQVSSENVQYLEFYHHCASRRIANDFDHPFWFDTTLQMAHSEACVRSALIAIGCLNKAATGSLKDATAYSGDVTKRRTSLVHYNRAVDLLLKRMSEPSYTPEIGLVACLLFICIEFMRGNNSTALVHFTSGLNIIAASRRAHRGSTLPNVIEDSLKPIFIRMLAIPLMYGIPTDLVTDNPPELCQGSFKSMKEAQKSLHKIRNTAMLFAHDMLPKIAEPPSASCKEWQDRDAILALHSAWLRSLEAFEQTSSLSPSEQASAHSLKASHYCTYIFVSCITFGNQLVFDEHIDNFKTLINHAERFLDYNDSTLTKAPGANFTFDTTIIPYLVFASTYCRCPATRRRAIDLLARNPPREGLCDAEQNIVVMKRLVEIEEAELDPFTGWPVERTRIWFVNIRDDMDEMGKFSANFAVGLWGEGKALPVVPPGVVLTKGQTDRLWREWFVV